MQLASGSWTVVAVPAQIYAVTGSSGMVGLTGLFGLVPLVVFGLPRALFPQLAHEAFGGPLEGGLEFALLFAAMPAVAAPAFRGFRLSDVSRADDPEGSARP